MNVLVFNCGSSSLTYKVFQRKTMHDGEVLIHGKAHRVGVKGTHPSFIEHHFGSELRKDTIPIGSHKEASSLVMDFI
ncbi:MAG: acetate kinase, partial [Candidatus Sumerlaeota bacterium]|nr:acetate kinase [Candidatus Sumerlaeota bacterium]